MTMITSHEFCWIYIRTGGDKLFLTRICLFKVSPRRASRTDIEGTRIILNAVYTYIAPHFEACGIIIGNCACGIVSQGEHGNEPSVITTDNFACKQGSSNADNRRETYWSVYPFDA